MSAYSPQAENLLAMWSCISQNMRSVIFRARYLQQLADRTNRSQQLEALQHGRHIAEQYSRIGQALRAFSSADGVEKQFPEDTELGPMGVGRFVDFRISEDAIPELCEQLEGVNRLLLELFVSLCAIRL